MQNYGNKELELLGLQIGCVIKLNRLQKGLSQEELGLLINANSTLVGRIERFEISTSWTNLFKVCKELDIEYSTFFKLKTLSEIISMVDTCLKLDNKLTDEKKKYYNLLKKTFTTNAEYLPQIDTI